MLNWEHITEVLFLLELLLLLTVVVQGFLVFGRLKQAYQYLTLYLLVVLLIEILAKLFIYVWVAHDNLFLLHIYVPLEFLLLSMVYRDLLLLNAQQRRWITRYTIGMFSLVVMYSCTMLLDTKWYQAEYFQLHSKLIVHGSLIAYASLLFAQLLRQPERFVHSYRAMMHFNSGVLLYFSGSVTIFLTINYLLASAPEQTMIFWFLNVILTIIFHFLCLLTLWRKDSRK
jgi:hypothetical protein